MIAAIDEEEGNESDGSWVNVSHSEDELPYIENDESEEGESEDDESEDEESGDSEEEIVGEEVDVRIFLIYCSIKFSFFKSNLKVQVLVNS